MARKTDTENHTIRDLYHKGLRAQRRTNRDFWLNSAFLRGDQWVYFNPSTRRLDQVPVDQDRVRVTINRLWGGSRTVISKLTQRPLVFEVVPNSADDIAIEGSKVGDAILHAVKTEHRWESIRESVAWSTWKGGVAAVCVDWDATKGKPTALADDGRKLPSGDTQETALSVAEFVVEPGNREAREANWWIKAQTFTPEAVKAQWGLEELPPADATAGLSSLEKALASAQHLGLSGPNESVADVPLTLVLTYYERPNPSRPDGRVEVIVNNKTVWGPKKWPFPFVDHLNLATTRETVVENTWLGETIVSAARPVQVAYNMAWSDLLEHADIAGNARLLTPQSALELTEQYSDIPGEVAVYMDGGDRPSWLSPPQLPNWLLQMPGELSAQIDDMLGVHDVSRGQAPANIESGYGLAVLAEQDATPIGKMSSDNAQMWSEVGSMVLKLYEANVKETRTAVTSRPGEPPETTSWTGATLAGQTTAVVPIELVAPRSRAAQAKLAETLLQMGMISTLEEMTRVAELPGERQLIAAVRPDIDRARRENSAMAQGKVMIPENFDNHSEHIAEHNNFRKSARYETMTSKLKDLYAAHIQAHETLAAEEAAQQQLRAQAGGPALASVPHGNGSEQVPVDPNLDLGIDNAAPAVDQQTVLDELSGDVGGAIDFAGSQASAEGAAITQQELSRDELLALMDAASSGG